MGRRRPRNTSCLEPPFRQLTLDLLLQHRLGKVRAFHDCALKAGTPKIGAREIRAAQIGGFEIRGARVARRRAIGAPERERSVKQLIGRVVDTITGWARTQKYFASEEDLLAFSEVVVRGR